jgi:hypothetical protein
MPARLFFNLSRPDFAKLVDDPNQLTANLNGNINRSCPRAPKGGVRA